VICAINRIPRARREESDRRRATTPQVRRLLKEVTSLDLAQRQKIPGIGPRRAEIIIPGAAVLLHVLEAFRMPALFYSSAGVRDGIIADLAARRVERGLSQLTPDQRGVVEQLAEHYGVSLRRARKVARLAADLFHGLQPIHKLAPEDGRLLEAAAYLYDSGHYVSDTRHHKHSYYLVANSDLPGFTRIEIELIANLCRYHRKALPTAEHDNLQALSADRRRAVNLLIPIIRMADSLDRSRGQRVRSVDCRVRDNDILITVNAPADTDIDLELWAAERLAEIFRQSYGKPAMIARL
jgi:exopolyphosphatase/guanosine-5'-triphosphate,3'-diphosphate pyrophosphatase